MKTQEMRILASEHGYESVKELRKEKCPSEFGYIDYGEVDNGKCGGKYDKGKCSECWKEATCPEDIETNIMEDDETFILTRKAFDSDEEYTEYLRKCNKAFEPKEQVNHPVHYSQAGRRECIEEMRLVFGDAAVKQWCIMTAYKYRYRTGNKEGNSAEQDNRKAEWYLDYAEEMS